MLSLLDDCKDSLVLAWSTRSIMLKEVIGLGGFSIVAIPRFEFLIG